MSARQVLIGGIALMIVFASAGLAAGFGSTGDVTIVAAKELGATDDDAVKAGAVAGGATLAAGVVAGAATGGVGGAIAGAKVGAEGATYATA